MTRAGLAFALAMLASPAWAAFDCPPPPDPVLSLSYGSRYAEGSESSEIDSEASADADDALRPVDDFLRDLTEMANAVFEDDADQRAIANCVVGQIATWADADALSDLDSETSNLTIGSRIGGFGLVLLQVLPHADASGDVDSVKRWLAGLMRNQTRFWETEAPNGARQGNLRAWAALGGASVAAVLDDPALRSWAAWSVSYILCTADEDGSLPQEMRRGKFALKYQLHAIAPLVVTTLLLDRQGIALQQSCDHALDRIVAFAVNDLASGDAARVITGETQSFFDGTDELEEFHLAWIEAYLLLDGSAYHDTLNQMAEEYRPLNYSKLGGNQTLIWQAME